MPVLIPNPVDQRLRVKCRALSATGRGVALVQGPGEVVEECQEAVAVEVAGVEEVAEVLVGEAEEGNMFKKENALQCIQNKC
jgi:hypothetical protein